MGQCKPTPTMPVDNACGATLTGVETWAIYGIGGEIGWLSMLPPTRAVSSPQKRVWLSQWTVTDHGEVAARTNVASAANGGTASASSTYVNPPGKLGSQRDN